MGLSNVYSPSRTLISEALNLSRKVSLASKSCRSWKSCDSSVRKFSGLYYQKEDRLHVDITTAPGATTTSIISKKRTCLSVDDWCRDVYSRLEAVGGGEDVLVGDEGPAAVLGVAGPPQQGGHPRPVLGISRLPAHNAVK